MQELETIIIVLVSVSTFIMSFLIYLSKASFNKGKIETKTDTRATVVENLITNAIKEIENLHKVLDKVINDINNEKIERTKLQEKLGYMMKRLEEIISDMKRENISQRSENQIQRDDNKTQRDFDEDYDRERRR